MSNQGVRHHITKVGKGKTRIKVNGSQKVQDPRIQLKMIMLYLKIILMDLNLENNIIEVMVGDSCSVGHVARSILRLIICKISVLDLRFIVHNKWIQLGMLGREFLRSMQHWITDRWITWYLLSG